MATVKWIVVLSISVISVVAFALNCIPDAATTATNHRDGDAQVAETRSNYREAPTQTPQKPASIDLAAVRRETNDWKATRAARWRDRGNLKSLEEKLKLATECLFLPLYSPATDETPDEIRITGEARDLLLAHPKEAITVLLSAIDTQRGHIELYLPISENAIVLLGQMGDRSAVAPLVERLLKIRDDLPYGAWRLAGAIARIGDEDVGKLLIKAFPYMTKAAQDAALATFAQIENPALAEPLLRWANSQPRGIPDYGILWALACQRDPRAEPIFRKALALPPAQAIGLRNTSLYGLLKLGISASELSELDAWSEFGPSASLAEFAGDLRYPIRFDTPNEELRSLVDNFVLDQRRERQSPRSELDLHLDLQVKGPIRKGQRPQYALLITNLGKATRTVMKSRDGSDVGWVCPNIQVAVRGPDKRDFQMGCARCGNVNGLHPPRDVVEIKPGETVDIFAGENAFGHYAIEQLSSFTTGSYRLSVTYDTKTKGSGGLGDSGERPDGVVAVVLQTKEYEVEVVEAKN